MSWVGNLVISWQEIPKGCYGLLQTAAPVAQWLLYSPTPKLWVCCGSLCPGSASSKARFIILDVHNWVCTDNRAAQVESRDLPAPTWMYRSCANMDSVGSPVLLSPAAAQDWSLLFIQTPVADLSHTISPVAGLRSLVFQLFASAHLNALSFADLYTRMQSQEFPENCPSSVGVEAMEFLFH